ncbi:DAK2 domain-containing protein, partial [Anaerospora hongkongensis]|uniref:DAK2 domain-containing protein n=1 Tax=Anaerospora hongkongensis TaxID=244830 RepID=UPI003A520BFC
MSNIAVAAMEYIGEAIIRNKDLLTSLDTAIGDSDHGINMARGFEAVSGKLRALPEEADIGLVLKTAA